MISCDRRDRGQAAEPFIARSNLLVALIGKDEINGSSYLFAIDAQQLVRCAVGRGRMGRHAKTILDGLEIRSNEDVFLDFGSGMGRAVIMAAKYPFRKIYGVEIARQLNEIARQNVHRALPRLKCRDIELITANAREFVIPDEATVIYFFNPFSGEVLTDVLQNIRASLRRRRRALRLICKIPGRSAFEEEIFKHTWLIKEREIIFDTNSRYLFLTVHDNER